MKLNKVYCMDNLELLRQLPNESIDLIYCDILYNTGKKFKDIGDYNYPIRNKNIRNKNNLSKEDIEELLFLLKTTNISMTELGKKFNFGRAAISNINRGIAYPIKDYNYPARI